VAGNSVAVLDVGSGRVVGQIPVGARPSQLSVGDGSLWVANLGDGTISQIDPRTRQVTRTLAVGQSAQSSVAGVAAGGDVFWTLDGGGVARRIDLESDTVRTTNVGTPFGAPFTGRWVDGPHTVALDRTGAWFLGVSSVARLDLRSGALRDHIAVGTNPASLATGYGSVWVTDTADDTVSRIDESSGAVIQTIPVGHEPSGIAMGAGAVWVADTADDTVERIDPQTGAITDAIPVAGGPRGVAVGDRSVWVADSKGGAVSRIDPASRRVVATIPLGQSPEDLAVVGKSVFVSVQPGDVRFVSAGGGLRLRVVTETDPLPSTDPALGYVDQLGFQLAYLTCATLLTYPDRPSPVGERLVPEVARAMPTVSAGGRIYTFYLRSDFRFSPPSGAPVTAQAFVRAIERALNARMNSYWGTLIEDVVGARAYSAGHASSVAGLSASANRLTIRLTAPAPQFLASISTLGFCAVPPTTPINPHGVEGIPDAGPYYVASRVPGQRLVLKRNPYYPGSRPRRVAEIDVNIGAAGGKAVRQVLSGADDYAPSVAPDRVAALESRYGAASAAARAGGQQYFENPTPTVDYLALNTRRALFARTALRRAVNFAIDRRALASEAVRALSDAGAQPTAQYLPPTLPGYTPAAIYPLGGPDLKVARRLARGGRGQGVIYTYTEPPGPELAQIIKQNLQGIGIQMEIKQFGKPQLYQRLLNPAEPWDIALVSFAADYPDPFDFLNLLFDSSHISPSANPPFGQYNNWSRFSSPVYDRRLHAASLLTGAGRLRTYGQLAISLARDAAPMAAWGAETSRDLFGAGIGCQIFQPVYGYDLSTLCRRTQHRV
jgi:peptide/nickel transport system substrate-binding protein